MKIVVVAGARPNFVKVSPLLKALSREPAVAATLVHTGQHYDPRMSDRFFTDMEIPAPDFNLGVGSGSHGWQTAEVMRRLEPILASQRPDFVLVVGDVNSTLASAVSAAKLGLRVAHVEAGLRSFDRTMPEEINRILIDAVSDRLFVTETSALMNLMREGISPDRIHFVGNVMIDALEMFRPKWEASDIAGRVGLPPGRPYAVLTLHRPSNVDHPERLAALMQCLSRLGERLPIVFPAHPRVKERLALTAPAAAARPSPASPAAGLRCLDPIGYLDCIALLSRARLVLTDSGGIQEETTALGVPCLTLRDNTERPVTVSQGTNRVVGSDPGTILREALRALARPPRSVPRPPLWDGRAAGRIVKILLQHAAPARDNARPSPRQALRQAGG